MIRWCRDSDHDRWATTWTTHWSTACLAPGRDVVAVDMALGADRRGPAAPSLPPPGGRVVLVVRVDVEAIDTTGWRAAWSAAGLIPEIAHACDPVPGDEQFDATGAASQDRRGRRTAGIVLARRITPADLEGKRLVIHHGPPLPGYLPLPTDQSIPLPVGPGIYTPAQLADAFGVADADVAALLDELVWAGVASLT